MLDRQRNVAGQIYKTLREKILRVELRPGEPIYERTLADMFDASRTPVREAIRLLSKEGLISIVPHVGTSVALIDAARLSECCFIRISLEAAGIRMAAERFTEREGAVLDGLVERQAATLDGPDIPTNIAIDADFHRTILATAGLKATTSLLDQVMGDIVRVRHLSGQVPGRLQNTIAEHRAIVAALRRGDPDACEAAMRAHLQASFTSVSAVLDWYPDYVA